MALITRQSEHCAQGRGLAGAVGADQPDDTAAFDREIGVIERNVGTVFFGQFTGFN
jgi:hypothetical protein